MTTAPKSEASLFFPTERQGRLLKTSNTEKLNGVLLQIAFQGEKKNKSSRKLKKTNKDLHQVFTVDDEICFEM